MKRQRNRSCVYTGLVGRKMVMPKPRANRRVKKETVTLNGGPLDGAKVRLDADNPSYTLPLAAMKGFPPGRYEHTTWKPEGQHEALQDHRDPCLV